MYKYTQLFIYYKFKRIGRLVCDHDRVNRSILSILTDHVRSNEYFRSHLSFVIRDLYFISCI